MTNDAIKKNLPESEELIWSFHIKSSPALKKRTILGCFIIILLFLIWFLSQSTYDNLGREIRTSNVQVESVLYFFASSAWFFTCLVVLVIFLIALIIKPNSQKDAMHLSEFYGLTKEKLITYKKGFWNYYPISKIKSVIIKPNDYYYFDYESFDLMINQENTPIVIKDIPLETAESAKKTILEISNYIKNQ